jgi:AraC-like DNA-binding protein
MCVQRLHVVQLSRAGTKTMPNSAVQTYIDPHEYQSSVRATDVTVLLTGRGRFQAKLTRMDLHRLWMRSGETSLPYIMRGAWTNHRCIVSFLTGPEYTPYHHNGLELWPGSILVNPLGTEFYRRSTGRRCGSMSLAPDDLAAVGHALVGREIAAPIATQMVRPPPNVMTRLLHLYDAAEKLTESAPEILTHPEVARAMEDELVRAMVRCLTDGNPVGSEKSRGQRESVMRRFERVLEENQDTPVHLTDICRAIGVSARSLRMHCQEHLGLSPHRYLWLRRMHQARQALALADAAAKTVTEIAIDHGFWELGRFSVAYRRLFDESPSATLRRPG